MDELTKQLQELLQNPTKLQDIAEFSEILEKSNSIHQNTDGDPTSLDAVFQALLPHLSKETKCRLLRAEKFGKLAKLLLDNPTEQNRNGGGQTV